MGRPRGAAKFRTQGNGHVRNQAPAAIAYVRVSTEEQANEGVSLEAQRARINAYAAAAGLEIVATITDAGVSGSKKLASRPAGAEIAQRIAIGCTNVIALKLDRLFRDAADCLNQTREWDSAGVTLHLVDMGGSSLNTSSAMGRMFLTMTAAFAELERNLIAERTSTALQHMRAQGKAYSPTPYGWDRRGDELVRNVEEQNVVILMYTLAKAGASYRQIAEELQHRGLRTKRGRTWHASTVRQILDRK